MIRRHRRVLPATIVAVLLLAAMVVLVVACVQLLLGQPPLIPFTSLGAAAGLTWSSGAVVAAGVVSAVLGVVLLACAWTRGSATVVPLAATEHSTAGATAQSLRRTVTATARAVDGVHSASATVTPRRVSATVATPLRDPTDLREQVATAIDAQLGALALDRTPRTRVRVTPARST